MHPGARARRRVVETWLSAVIVLCPRTAELPPWHLRCTHCRAFALVAWSRSNLSFRSLVFGCCDTERVARLDEAGHQQIVDKSIADTNSAFSPAFDHKPKTLIQPNGRR